MFQKDSLSSRVFIIVLKILCVLLLQNFIERFELFWILIIYFLHLNYIYMPFCFTVSTAFTRGPTTQHSNNSHCLELLTQAPTQTLTCSLPYPQHKVVQAGNCGLECDLTLVCLR